jgi:hypothetical protein
MVKLRMNTADVAAEVRCLRKLIGMRCANVYDLTPKVRISAFQLFKWRFVIMPGMMKGLQLGD